MIKVRCWLPGVGAFAYDEWALPERFDSMLAALAYVGRHAPKFRDAVRVELIDTSAEKVGDL